MYKIHLFISIAALLLFAGCQKDKTANRDYPQVRTLAVDKITAEGVRFNASIISGSAESITEYGFVWGKSNNLSIQYSEKVVEASVPEKDRFTLTVSYGFEPKRDYYARAYIKVGDLIVYGEVVSFKSL
jgi:hypothetical protein